MEDSGSQSATIPERTVYCSIIPNRQQLVCHSPAFCPLSRPVSSQYINLLDISGTSIRPSAEMCASHAHTIGMRALVNATTETIPNMLQACLRHVQVLDISDNQDLDNLTMLQSVLEQMSIALPISADDSASDTRASLLQMRGSPVGCALGFGTQNRPWPESMQLKNLSSSSYYNSQHRLPALNYSCQCSANHVVNRAGICQLRWSTQKIAWLAIGCTVAVGCLLLWLGLPRYYKRRRHFKKTLELQRGLLDESQFEV